MKKELFLQKISTTYTKAELIQWLSAIKKTPERDNLLNRIKSDGNILLSEGDINSLTFGIAVASTNVVDKTTEPKTTIKPNIFKKGDVLMHSIFRHPYILLDFVNNQWICGLLTTDEKCSEILEPCNSRMFHSSYFTKTIFTAQKPDGKFMSIFENASQVRSVYKKLKKIFN